MTIARAYTYLGKLKAGAEGQEYHVWEGIYSFAAADLYDQDARPSLTFAGLSRVSGIIGIAGFGDSANNLGYPVVMLSISSRTVTLMVLETGAAAAGLAEKTDNEAYGVDGSIRCVIFGL